ncbi:hypothetical protein [Aliterella atlantica]|uniref:Uncharacterized protein n=1 Tax=Aliterella atlantica CENA595 TaxID=1618023 RepID=A0A0D8ZKM2_9CYAN|nr:hypothetical protein [Aliterella atlantica]KJH69388.1 hypothetical protein UH38_24085 [Aliterella atlantica CENA595]
MVERPIKKSERQIAEPSDAKEAPESQQPSAGEENATSSSTPLPEKRKVIPPVAGKENSKGRKGKGAKKEDEPAAPVNLALMRGPKPSKPKPPPAVTTSSPDETQTDSDQNNS